MLRVTLSSAARFFSWQGFLDVSRRSLDPAAEPTPRSCPYPLCYCRPCQPKARSVRRGPAPGAAKAHKWLRGRCRPFSAAGFSLSRRCPQPSGRAKRRRGARGLRQPPPRGGAARRRRRSLLPSPWCPFPSRVLPSLPALPGAGNFRFLFSGSRFSAGGGDGGGFLLGGGRGLPGGPDGSGKAWLERIPVPPLFLRDAAHPAAQPQRPPRRGAHRERGALGSAGPTLSGGCRGAGRLVLRGAGTAGPAERLARCRPLPLPGAAQGCSRLPVSALSLGAAALSAAESPPRPLPGRARPFLLSCISYA